MAGYLIRATVIVPKDVVELEDGQTVATGTTVDLPETYGNHLVAEKLAERADDSDSERGDLIRDAIDGLDKDADFTKGGKPDVDKINAAMPEGSETVTAVERDAIWASMEE